MSFVVTGLEPLVVERSEPIRKLYEYPGVDLTALVTADLTWTLPTGVTSQLCVFWSDPPVVKAMGVVTVINAEAGEVEFFLPSTAVAQLRTGRLTRFRIRAQFSPDNPEDCDVSPIIEVEVR